MKSFFFFFFKSGESGPDLFTPYQESYFLENFLSYFYLIDSGLSEFLRHLWGGGKVKESQQCSRNCQRLVEHKEARDRCRRVFVTYGLEIDPSHISAMEFSTCR